MLRFEPGVSERRGTDDFRERWEHLFRVSDEEDVNGLFKEAQIHLNEMVCHLFHEQYRRSAGSEDHISDDFRCVC